MHFEDHPAALDRMIDVGVQDITTLISRHEFVVYGLQHFGEAVQRSVAGAEGVCFDITLAAYRTSLARFCTEPVAVGQFYSVDRLHDWAETRGVRGLIGIYPAGRSTKVYLSEITGLVLCRLEFG